MMHQDTCTSLCHRLAAQPLPPGGTYTLLLWAPTHLCLRIGALGLQSFPRGYYTYTGSAKRHLAARLHRHVHGTSTRHWHIDYLRPYVRVLAWHVYAGETQPECLLNHR